MTAVDYVAAIREASSRVLLALDADPDGAVHWCGDWTVKDCAQHVAGAHHVVAQVVQGRPTTDFGVFADLEVPTVTDPALRAWVASGADRLLDQLERTDPDEPCWSWWPPGDTIGFWHRRMAHETLVHRWDVERAAGVDVGAMDPSLAADGVDEHLDVFVRMTRRTRSSPGAGETVHVHCTDTDGEWVVTFPEPGRTDLRRAHAKGDAAFRGPAEGLLLFLWGRLDADDAGVEVLGDQAVAGRWRELAPTI